MLQRSGTHQIYYKMALLLQIVNISTFVISIFVGLTSVSEFS